MTDAEIYRGIAEVLDDVLGVGDINLMPQTTADQVEGWDSLTNINIMIAVEGRFGIRLHSSEIESFKNVGDLVRTIRNRVTVSP